MTNIVYISAGSNIGDRAENIRRGIGMLADMGDIVILDHAGYYETAPVDYVDQPWFVNTVFKLSTRLSPSRLLARLKAAERMMGRKTGGIRFGPRILDFDILFYNDLVMNTPGLVIPHPRLHCRGFVLYPLMDIGPDLVHPVLGKTVKELTDDLDGGGGECLLMTGRQEALCAGN